MRYPSEALATAREIIYHRKFTLEKIVPQLGELCYYQEALAATREIKFDGRKADVLVNLVFYISISDNGQVLTKALAAAREIKNGGHKAEAMAGIAHYLQEPEKRKVLKEVLKASETIEGDVDRDSALAKLASRLAELGYYRNAIVAVRKMKEKQE